MLFVLIAHLTSVTERTGTALARRLAQARSADVDSDGLGGEAGLSTLEVVIIALGVFLLAAAAVAVITAAVNGRLSKIT